MNKKPEQTIHTRQKIMNTFWSLAAEQGLNKVTVSAVTKKSGFNRSTFYVYFMDITDLLAQSEEDIILDLQERMRTAITKGTMMDRKLALQKMVETFTLYDDKLFLLIGRNGDPDFIAKIEKEMSIVFRDVFDMEHENPHSDYLISYIASALIGLLTYWHEKGRKISIEELADIHYGMITKGLPYFFGEIITVP